MNNVFNQAVTVIALGLGSATLPSCGNNEDSSAASTINYNILRRTRDTSVGAIDYLLDGLNDRKINSKSQLEVAVDRFNGSIGILDMPIHMPLNNAMKQVVLSIQTTIVTGFSNGEMEEQARQQLILKLATIRDEVDKLWLPSNEK